MSKSKEKGGSCIDWECGRLKLKTFQQFDFKRRVRSRPSRELATKTSSVERCTLGTTINNPKPALQNQRLEHTTHTDTSQLLLPSSNIT